MFTLPSPDFTLLGRIHVAVALAMELGCKVFGV